jgi:hypothetical protein
MPKPSHARRQLIFRFARSDSPDTQRNPKPNEYNALENQLELTAVAALVTKDLHNVRVVGVHGTNHVRVVRLNEVPNLSQQSIRDDVMPWSATTAGKPTAA